MRDQGWAIWVLAHDGCTDILGLFWCVRFECVRMKNDVHGLHQHARQLLRPAPAAVLT